jgi:hypothetical protein
MPHGCLKFESEAPAGRARRLDLAVAQQLRKAEQILAAFFITL